MINGTMSSTRLIFDLLVCAPINSELLLISERIKRQLMLKLNLLDHHLKELSGVST